MRIFLDDERIPVQPNWEVIRNHDDFIMTAVLAAGHITAISFDHDLGDDSESGAWCLHWLVDEMLNDDPLMLPKLQEITIHTADRMGGENMMKYLTNAQEHVPQLRTVKITWFDSTVVKGHAVIPDDFDPSSKT